MTGPSQPEVGLFIIWAHGRSHEASILEEIRARFDVSGLYEVHWSAPMISRNFSRFYRGRPWAPYRTSLEQQKGRGPFLAVVVVDRSPRYGERDVTGGRRLVNTKIFDTKEAIRDRTGGGYRFHSADTAHTAARELVLLFGRSPQTWLAEEAARGPERVIAWREDPIASEGWRSRRDLFEALGWCTTYVDLDGGCGASGGFTDETPIRLITHEYKELLSILGARPANSYLPMWGGSFSVPVNGRDVPIEVRSHRDGYLDRIWVDDIVERRILRSNGAFGPADEDLFENSLYRVFAHQPTVRTGDMERLRGLASRVADRSPEELTTEADARDLLKTVMAEKSYHFTRPRDRSVYYNHRLAGSQRPELRLGVDEIARRWERIFGRLVLAPVRRVVLGTREWLLVHVPSLRSVDDLARRGRPRSNRSRQRVSGRR